MCVYVCECVCKVKAPPLQPHVPLLAEDRNPARTACVSPLSFPTVSIKREQIGERKREKDAIPVGSPPAAVGIV